VRPPCEGILPPPKRTAVSRPAREAARRARRAPTRSGIARTSATRASAACSRVSARTVPTAVRSCVERASAPSRKRRASTLRGKTLEWTRRGATSATALEPGLTIAVGSAAIARRAIARNAVERIGGRDAGRLRDAMAGIDVAITTARRPARPEASGQLPAQAVDAAPEARPGEGAAWTDLSAKFGAVPSRAGSAGEMQQKIRRSEARMQILGLAVRRGNAEA
jgi:hypothetical protein